MSNRDRKHPSYTVVEAGIGMVNAANSLTPNNIMHPQESAPARQAAHTAFILVSALLLRLLVLVVVVQKYPNTWLYARGTEMGFLAKSFLAGQGLSSPFGESTGPTAFIAPFYPIYIASIFHWFGIESVASTIVIISSQIVLNLLTIWIMMSICRQLSGNRAAVIAGCIWAFSPPLLWLPTIFWETSFSALLIVVMLSLALQCIQQPTTARWVVTGLFAGATALVNPALVPTSVAVFMWTAYCTRNKYRLAPLAALAIAIVVFSPWPIRNARRFHAFVPTRTTVGFELWMGNHPGSSGFLDESLFPTFNPQELAAYKQMGEIQYTHNKSTLATQYILAHPVQFLRLTIVRIFRFWTGTGTQGGSIFFLLHALITSLFGLFGLKFLVKKMGREVGGLFLLPVLIFPLPYYITHAEFRYRIVIDPILTILAAYSLSLLNKDHLMSAQEQAHLQQI